MAKRKTKPKGIKVSLGNLVDQLTVCNIRIWMAEDVKRKKGASDKVIADACKITNVANSLRNDLIEAIDNRGNEIAAGIKQKSYKQGSTKMYGKK
ncbi:MAG TPA: DUF4254 domain-containing protein [Bacteroidia bacterium]|nr:DUF4254 domain-containing protein [Bacteroidia bacterium]